MSTRAVETYLRDHIPLSAGMDIEVVEAGAGGVTIQVPLEPINVNHHATAFGGSVAALAILAGWTLVHLRLQEEGIVTRLVIQRSAVQYDAPIQGPFRAVTRPVSEREWDRFTRAIGKRGRGRVHVEVDVMGNGSPAATFTGAYVAIDGD